MKETFGQRLARLRKKAGFKQEEIAERVNISAQAVSKWENDLSAPDILTLPILADVFNISVDELLGREVVKTSILPSNERKDINSMLLKINILSHDGDKVKINFPLSIIKLCIDSNLELPNINGINFLKNIDFNQIFMMIDAGVIGKLIEIESTDGDIISISAE